MFEDRMFKTEAKATTFCPRAVLEVEDSPRGPDPNNKLVKNVILVLVNNLQSSESNTQMVVVGRYFGYMIRLLKIGLGLLNESASAVSAGSLFQAEIVLGTNELRNASVKQ